MRGCACQGNQGFAHVSCLVHVSYLGLQETKDQSVAQELIDNTKGLGKIIERILSCKLCKKRHNAIILRTQIPINVYSTKKTQITSRLLVGCHTQASGYFWRGDSTVLGFGGPPMTIGQKSP